MLKLYMLSLCTLLSMSLPTAAMRNPLHEATEAGDVELVSALLLSGAGVNARNDYGDTPLHLAAYYGHYEVVQLLIAHGAKVDEKNDNFGSTPLHRAVMPLNGCKVVQLLIANKANVNAKNNSGSTALHTAALLGHHKGVKLLLGSGANVDEKDNSNATPIHMAALNGHQKVVLCCITYGAHINVKDNYGSTPLHWAIMKGRHAIAQLLITHGAPVDEKDKRGSTPSDIAAANGHHEVALLASHWNNFNRGLLVSLRNGLPVARTVPRCGKYSPAGLLPEDFSVKILAHLLPGNCIYSQEEIQKYIELGQKEAPL